MIDEQAEEAIRRMTLSLRRKLEEGMGDEKREEAFVYRDPLATQMAQFGESQMLLAGIIYTAGGGLGLLACLVVIVWELFG